MEFGFYAASHVNYYWI